MIWLRRKIRPLLVVAGGVLLIGSLLGARLLTHGSGGGGDAAGKPAASPTNGKDGSGPVVLGYVDSDPPPVSHGLPPVLQSGEIAQVFVAQGAVVKVGDPLYKFNTRLQEADQKVAEQAVAVARTKVREAQALEQQHKSKIELQKQKLEIAVLKVNRTQKGYHVYESNLRKSLTVGSGPERVKELLADDTKLFELETGYMTAVRERDVEKATLTALEVADTGATVAEADAEVKARQLVTDKARDAVEMCTVRAQVVGTVERVNVSPGEVMGISTRAPAVVLVPAGPRVVRAEVEAEFAHRVGTDRIGKPVTILDNTDPKVAYKGTVKQISNSFLAKRGGEGGFMPSETRVLEAVVEVTDPNPPGQPPLRVGQRVRVNFGP